MELLAIVLWSGVLGIAITVMVNANRWAYKLFPPKPAPPERPCRKMVDAVRIFVREVNGTTDEQK